MSTVKEIEAAIAKLQPGEIRQIATWINALKPASVPSEQSASMRKAWGLWKDRTDLPDFQEIRREGDRF